MGQKTISLADHYGVLDPDVGAELAEIVERRREERTRAHRGRIEELDVASY